MYMYTQFLLIPYYWPVYKVHILKVQKSIVYSILQLAGFKF